MKRSQIFIALLFAGGLFAGSLNAAPQVTYTYEMGQLSIEPTDTEVRILKAFALEFDISYQAVYNMFVTGSLEIIDNGNHTYTVIAQIADGNPLIATLEDYI